MSKSIFCDKCDMCQKEDLKINGEKDYSKSQARKPRQRYTVWATVRTSLEAFAGDIVRRQRALTAKIFAVCKFFTCKCCIWKYRSR